jgi:muramidase (phage lysozyme)
MCAIDAATAGGANICAFLDMLGYSEGTRNDPKTQNDGYDVIVGGSVFTDYSDHPRVYVSLPNLGINSSAAGRYQVLARYYDVYKVQLGLPDFSPLSQDLIAVQMIKECHAIQLLQNGNITAAIPACSSRWASLPGNSYGQYQQTITKLLAWYEAAGGTAA